MHKMVLTITIQKDIQIRRINTETGILEKALELIRLNKNHASFLLESRVVFK